MRRRGVVTSVAAVAVLVTGGIWAAQAAPPLSAAGEFAQSAITDVQVRPVGPNLIVDASTVGSVSGTLAGSFADSVRVVIRPDGRFSARGRVSCDCTVAGRSGVLEFRVTDTGGQVSPETAAFTGQAEITSGTGELAGLRGVFSVDGVVDKVTGLSTWSYAGQIHAEHD